MKFLVICLLFVNIMVVSAKDIAWSYGSIVLRTGEIVSGIISLDQHHQIVLNLKSNKMTDVIPAHRISMVYFYDETNDINRRFVSLAEDPSSRQWNFYEIVLNGDVKVYRKKKLANTFSNNPDLDNYDYYVLQDKCLVLLKMFRTKIYPGLASSLPGLKNYIKDQKLHINRDADAVAIIKYYNSKSTVAMR
jgi:hypothetical protein